MFRLRRVLHLGGQRGHPLDRFNERNASPFKGDEVSIGNTSEPTIDFQGEMLVFRGVKMIKIIVYPQRIHGIGIFTNIYIVDSYGQCIWVK